MQLLERSLLRALEDTATPLAGARVLDVGCGTGYFLHRLSDYGASECHGIDLVADRIEAARDRYPGQTWHLGSATELPFPDGSFDLVTQFTCLSSIVDNATRAAAAREMLRVAGRDGRVLSFDMRVGSRPDSPRHADGRARRATPCARSSASRACCDAPALALRPGAGRRSACPDRAGARARCDRSAHHVLGAVGRCAPPSGCGSASSSTASIPTASAAASAGIARSPMGSSDAGHDVTYLTLRQWDPATGPGVPGFEVVSVAGALPLYSEGRRSIGAQLRFALGVLRISRGTARATTSCRLRRCISLCLGLFASHLRGFGLVVDWFEVWRRGYWLEYLGPVAGRLGWFGSWSRRAAPRCPCFSRLHAERLRSFGHGARSRSWRDCATSRPSRRARATGGGVSRAATSRRNG